MPIEKRPEFADFAQTLADMGLRKHAGMVFTVPLQDGVLGWLGLNSATQGYPKDCGMLHPVIGVRNDEVQRELAELLRTPYRRYTPPTASVPLSTLLSDPDPNRWEIGADPAAARATLADLRTSVEDDGLPWMRAHTNLDAMIAHLRAHPDLDGLTLPVALQHAGHHDDAHAEMDALRARYADDDTGFYAQYIRGVVDAFTAAHPR